jgi:putative DNA primase/helicase
MQHERVDTAELLASVDIVEIIGRTLDLKKEGPNWKGFCPFHSENSRSLVVSPVKKIFKCFGCGEGGDVISWLQKDQGMTFLEAVNSLKDPSTVDNGLGPKKRRQDEPPRPKWVNVRPAPQEAKSFRHYHHGEPSLVWPYVDDTGGLLGYVCRFDLPDGSKEVLPFTYCTDGNRQEWRFQGFDKPRPLYSIQESDPTKTVILVEGEKACDAVQAHIDTGIVMTWPGGAQAVDYIDWSHLAGRTVILWPDNDQPGESAMLHIAQHLTGVAKAIKWVKVPAGLPKGWDGADRDWKKGECKKFVLDNHVDLPAAVPAPEWFKGESPAVGCWRHTPVAEEGVFWSAKFATADGFAWRFKREPVAPAPAPEPEQAPPPEFDNQHIPPPDDTGHGIDHADFFRFLGFSKAEGGGVRYHFFIHNSNIVLSCQSGGLNKTTMMAMAPLQWWEIQFPGRSNGFNLDSAQNWLIQAGNAAGSFSDKYMRGRGAWIDGRHVVIHNGDHLLIDGERREFKEHVSRFIYEALEPLDLKTEAPLPKHDAHKLMDMLGLMNWERDINRYLLAGWCVIAPVCGALKWRPHIWLTGGAGCGKSWTLTNIVRRLLGNTGIAVQGTTSEAGLRQLLSHDALPVVFDEAEGEDRLNQERMQAVLGLMRSASTDDSGIMAKGSTNGGAAKTYVIRSCFAFGSIAVQVAQQADRTRVTILGMKADESQAGKDRWARLQALYAETMTDDFVHRMQARTIKLLPIILENARVFSAAAAALIGKQRTGDQLGAMLAGAYSLHSDQAITYDQACAWISERNWDEERALDRTKDELALLATLMDHLTQVETNAGRFERTIGELASYAAHHTTDAFITHDIANDRLRRLGMKVEDGMFVVSNGSGRTPVFIDKMLQNTPWGKNHSKILIRLEGAVQVESTRFAGGIQTRAVAIPLKILAEKT